MNTTFEASPLFVYGMAAAQQLLIANFGLGLSAGHAALIAEWASSSFLVARST
jgi:hypothetical protein